MATLNGTPTIPTDGLVFIVDPGNSTSYISGSTTTTNLIGGNIGNLYNDVSGSMAENPKSWQFDQVDDKIDFGDIDLNMPDSGSFTVAAWTNTDTLADNNIRPGLVCKHNDSTEGFILRQRRHSSGNYGKFDFIINDRIALTTSIGDVGEWVYIVGAYDGNNGRIYFNGVYEAVTGSTIYKSVSNSLLIGQNPPPTSTTFNGKIGPIMIWNRELSAAEILQNYNTLKPRFT